MPILNWVIPGDDDTFGVVDGSCFLQGKGRKVWLREGQPVEHPVAFTICQDEGHFLTKLLRKIHAVKRLQAIPMEIGPGRLAGGYMSRGPWDPSVPLGRKQTGWYFKDSLDRTSELIYASTIAAQSSVRRIPGLKGGAKGVSIEVGSPAESRIEHVICAAEDPDVEVTLLMPGDGSDWDLTTYIESYLREYGWSPTSKDARSLLEDLSDGFLVRERSRSAATIGGESRQVRFNLEAGESRILPVYVALGEGERTCYALQVTVEGESSMSTVVTLERPSSSTIVVTA